VSRSKLSFHIDCVPRPGAVERIIKARPQVLFVTYALDVMNAVHRAVPGCKIIARDWKVGQDFLSFIGSDDPKRAAQAWFDALEPVMRQAKFAYWQSFNEMTTRGMIPAYAQFEYERQLIMGRYGYKACLFNWAVGTPEMEDWKVCLPALREADKQRSILGLHEYWPEAPWVWYGSNDAAAVREGRVVPFPEWYAEGWLFGRYRKVWRGVLLPAGLTHVPIVLTEMGCGVAVEGQPQYLDWKTSARHWGAAGKDPVQYYLQQLSWCDRQMRYDPFVLGGCIFVWGTVGSLWLNFEIDGPVADGVLEMIQNAS